ncbi:MAG: Carboxylesterase [Anaerolineales bacterium]|nr:Carboxylesterase [Anaerolineales bacterium]
MSQIIETAEPFFFLGDSTKPACLLVHGFTGAPKEMRLLGEFLNQHGYTCLGVRLTGHATVPEDMVRSRYTDWMASVEDGYHLLRGVSQNIILVGLSMGGVLSLLMSTKLSVMGVVAMSTPYRLPHDYPIWMLKLVSVFKKFNPKGKGKPGSGWFDKDAYREQVSYPQNPIRSTAELKKLILEMRAALPNVHAPVLLMHSKDDAYVLPENMERIYAELVNAEGRTKLSIGGSGHVVTKDAARQQVFESALEFIQRIGGKV